MLTGDESYGEGHPEEDEGSHRPQQEPNFVQWTVPVVQVRQRKRKTGHLERFLESYIHQKRLMDEADQKRRDEEKAVFENFIKTQQEAEQRQFRAITEQQRASNQLLLHMMGTLVKALLPQTDAPSAECLPTAPPVSPFARHPNDPLATMADPHPATSPQEILMAHPLPETSSSLLNDINTQVFDRSKLFVTSRKRGWLRLLKFLC